MMRNLLTGVLVLCTCCALHAQVMYKVRTSGTISISGTSTLSDWVVKSEKVTAEMTLTPSGKNDGVLPQGEITGAKAVLSVTDIKSERGETMDNKMYGALKSDEFPQIRFALADPITMPAAPATVSAKGSVELAGVTKTMVFSLDVSGDKNKIRFSGKKSLKMSDFEIEPPTAMFGQIEAGDEIVINLDLLFEK